MLLKGGAAMDLSFDDATTRRSLRHQEMRPLAPVVRRDPMLGKLLGGRYLLEEKLGAGSMGVVYRATQRPLGKTVAVKVLQAHLSNDPAATRRFLREAQASSRFDHPNSVAVYDFGREPDGTSYLVMEYLRGESLDDLIQRRGTLSPARSVAIMSQVLGAIAEAHDCGIVHRDLKPENIMLVDCPADDDEAEGYSVKVTDFGIAKLLDEGDELKLTAAGVTPGSPAYMSPEQASAGAIDGRSDLYQCGVILYEMVTGNIPFVGESAVSVIMQHMTDPAPSARLANPECPPELDHVIRQAMEKDPDARFSNARAMRNALRFVAPQQVASIAATRPNQKAVSLPVLRADTPLSTPAMFSLAPPVEAEYVPTRRAKVATFFAAAAVFAASALLTLHPGTPAKTSATATLAAAVVSAPVFAPAVETHAVLESRPVARPAVRVRHSPVAAHTPWR